MLPWYAGQSAAPLSPVMLNAAKHLTTLLRVRSFAPLRMTSGGCFGWYEVAGGERGLMDEAAAADRRPRLRFGLALDFGTERASIQQLLDEYLPLDPAG